ncbi:MAG TPA: carboxypeptidase-like regulatory domain-containing protein [candidate division Zixibacteria bacterium]|nr:carboxypeptidase-like regulatory domain-containing protein [candidate division Zixibacteria bacterium]
MRSTFHLRILLGALVATLAGPVRCGIPTAELFAQEMGSGSSVEQGKSPQGYRYLHGGVSSEEREAIEALAKDYNVQLTFAEKRGPYLAGIKLAVAEIKGGEIVSLTTNGPFFYIQLPSGDYRVSATFNGVTREIKRISVPKGKTVRRTLTWDLGEQSPELKER